MGSVLYRTTHLLSKIITNMSMLGTRVNGSVTEVRMFLRAESAEALVRSQFNNNLKYKSQFGYTDFTQSPIDQKWYCWFLIDIQLIEQSKPKLKPKK